MYYTSTVNTLDITINYLIQVQNIHGQLDTGIWVGHNVGFIPLSSK